MPPGATHAIFSMVDANGYLLHSEAMPAVCDVGHQTHDSAILKNGYAYKPGLYSLIKLGERAQQSTKKASQDTAALSTAIASAKTAYATDNLSDEGHCDALRALRAVIRNQKGTTEANNIFVNRFPTEPLF